MKKFFRKIWAIISSLWNKIDDYTEQHVDQALQITSGLKKFLESPTADILEAIIPGDIDALVRKQLLLATTHAVTALGIIDACKGLNDEQKFKCIVAELAKLPEAGRDAVFFKLASLISKYLNGGRLPNRAYDLLVQAKYYKTKS